MAIPQNYLPIMPYLILDKSADFLEYSKKVFGATEQMIVPSENGTAIMHGEIKIGDAVIMFANSTDAWKEKPAGMFLYVTDVNRVYNAGVEQGGTALQKPEQKEYGFSAGFEDPFGNQWWITQL
ncbi:VOC family protein [Flavobacterium sp. Sd200]|uniref:VOC family protein n=1 Tax=Flavobacterium sp. Sd200 TaxID=2692211 RepID=UPI00136E62CE|nr:VOC family protein [Flavobacterium sp. Sd200]MXN92407.1 VOC family protein [Flavobacterium sp. Sd200]